MIKSCYLQAMLHHAESIIQNMGGLIGGPQPAETVPPNRISQELLSTLNVEASLAAAYAARKASYAHNFNDSTRVRPNTMGCHAG